MTPVESETRPHKRQSRFPAWMRKTLSSEASTATADILACHQVNTVCDSARCPNRSECYGKGRATFLIMGPVCSRSCSFCSVTQGVVQRLDPDEPEAVASAASELRLRHVVITSVSRDDLPDGGADHFAATVRAVKKRLPEASIEVLVPDFLGRTESVACVCHGPIHIFNHNIETVPRLYRAIRPEADFERSLKVLRFAKDHFPAVLTKSGLMVGLGETDDEIVQVITLLKESQCDMLTIGHYLKPVNGKKDIERFVLPESFAKYAEYAYNIGFKSVRSAPFVRSSYNAHETFALLADSYRPAEIP
jgi:lipoyl synthase